MKTQNPTLADRLRELLGRLGELLNPKPTPLPQPVPVRTRPK